MNPPPDQPHDPAIATDARLWLQAACIFAAALVFGVFYNGLSPLGVRPPPPTPAGAVAVAGAVSDVVVAKPGLVHPGVFNETVSMTLEGAAGSVAQPAPAHPMPAVAQTEVPRLTWPQVRGLLEAKAIVLVDARPKVAFDLGHIPGAVCLPSNAPLPELQAFATGLPKDSALVIYCGANTCGASQHLARQLAAVGGFRSISEMPGGFAEYTLAQTTPASPAP